MMHEEGVDPQIALHLLTNIDAHAYEVGIWKGAPAQSLRENAYPLNYLTFQEGD